MDVGMAHHLLVRWRGVCRASSVWCELGAWVSWAAVNAELQVLWVVVPPPLVHGDHRQARLPVRAAHGGAALRVLARVAPPHGDDHGGNEQEKQYEGQDQVEGVYSAHDSLQPPARTALTDVFLPKTSLQQITTGTTQSD